MNESSLDDKIERLEAFEDIYIPILPQDAQQPFIDLVETILFKKENDEDTTAE